MARIEVTCSVTGTVWKLNCKAGDKVEAGDTLMLIESMKMEIPLTAEEGGTVESIPVAEGDAVTEGQLVAVLAS